MNSIDNKIVFTQSAAHGFLAKKVGYFRKRGRVPKIVLTGRSCSGAQFRLFFEAPDPGDVAVSCQDFELYLQPGLLDSYQGFELSLEYFFFVPRLKICPIVQSYACDCKNKCNKADKSAK